MSVIFNGVLILSIYQYYHQHLLKHENTLMKKILIILLISGVSFTKVNAQGCSDAGFCSLKYNSQQTKEDFKNMASVGNVIGKADGNTFVNGSYISYNRKLGSSVYWDTKFRIIGRLQTHTRFP
jgi:hypothetical protein